MCLEIELSCEPRRNRRFRTVGESACCFFLSLAVLLGRGPGLRPFSRTSSQSITAQPRKKNLSGSQRDCSWRGGLGRALGKALSKTFGRALGGALGNWQVLDKHPGRLGCSICDRPHAVAARAAATPATAVLLLATNAS